MGEFEGDKVARIRRVEWSVVEVWAVTKRRQGDVPLHIIVAASQDAKHKDYDEHATKLTKKNATQDERAKYVYIKEKRCYVKANVSKPDHPASGQSTLMSKITGSEAGLDSAS